MGRSSTSVGLRLKEDIRAAAEIWKNSSAFFRGAGAGRVTPQQAATYVAGLIRVLRQSGPIISSAAETARNRGLLGLAEFYDEKSAEEAMHYKWAERDYAMLVQSFGLKGAIEAPSAADGLLAFQRRIIEADPVSYLGYLLIGEYSIVLVGDELLANLEQRCGIPRRMMTAIGNHVVLDAEHVDDDVAFIDEYATGYEGDLHSKLWEAMAEASTYYDAMSREVMGG